MSVMRCWCGNDDLTPFSPDYARCNICQTLISNHRPDTALSRVDKDEESFYGRDYWFSHQEKDLGQPNVISRSRSDLPERCLHWLKTLLRYKLPPSRVLELGSAHGGFVAMMKWAGFDAAGLELSPWVVDFAKKTFGVRMLEGPVEEQSIEPASLDAIALMDVLEHLPDPVGTIRHCLQLLKPDGVLLLQTPCYREARSYEDMLSDNDPFLALLKEDEHLYLFSNNSITDFFKRLGAGHVLFEQAIFAHYDMFVVASKEPQKQCDAAAIETVLAASAGGRIIQALIDLDNKRISVTEKLKESEMDRANRLEVMNRQSEQLSALSLQVGELAALSLQVGELAALRQQVEELSRQCTKSEEDRATSMKVIRNQPATIAIDVTPIQPGGICGGIKQLVLELLKGFGEKAPSDKFILLTTSGNDHLFHEFDKYGMKRICVAGGPINKKNSLLKMGKDLLTKAFKEYERRGILRKNGVSVLFCPLTAPTFHERGIPTVSIICDLQHMYYPSFFGRKEFEYRQHYYKQLKRKVDHFICISEYTRQTAIDGLALPANRVFTIPICVQSRLTLPPDEIAAAVLQKFGLDGKTYAIYPANLWPHKNHKMLIVAFRMFLSRYPEIDVHLVLTGARIEVNFDELLLKMGLGDRVHFLDYLDESELSVLWDRSHLLIFPSLFEGFGIPLVEAMMYRKPILASNVTSIPEVAGDAALYFDPRRPDEIVSALYAVMSNSGVYRELVEKGIKRLSKFNFSDMVERYLEVLHLASSGSGLVQHTDVTGIYEDAWAAEKISISHESAAHDKIFTLKGVMHAWHPKAQMKITTFKDGRKKKVFMVRRNESFLVEETLPACGGMFDIVISKGFTPKNGDTRRLTFSVESASIIEKYTGLQLYGFGNEK